MALQLNKVLIEYLKEQIDEKLTARQIAEWVFKTYPAECQEKKANSRGNYIKTDTDLVQQMASEIGSRRPYLQRRHPGLKTTEDRPRKYYYSEKSDIDEIAAAEDLVLAPMSGTSKTKLGEHDMYPLLSLYLWEEFKVYSKRINEKCSSNKQGTNGNRWLHPDVVGMDNLGADWHQEVRNCVKQYSDKRTKLWSFEVKMLINRSNVRECFFQAVSNSSWANFGYLVAAEIEGQSTLKELRMLFAAHGIGLIKLDAENPDESQVLIPAREKDEIDWDMVNRLATENKDFMMYVKLVKQFYQTGEARTHDWDVQKATDLG